MNLIKRLWAALDGWLHGLLAWVESLAAAPHASWALFAIAFAESSVFPIPPDALLIPLCVADPSRAFWFAAVCSAGSVLGGVLGYGLGLYGGRPLLTRMFKHEKIEAVERYYDRYNAWATGIAGLTPLPYKVFTISAGAFAVGFRIFVLASVLSRSLRFFAVAALAYMLGDRAKQFIENHLAWLSILFVILLICGFWLVGRKVGRVTGEASSLDEEPAADRDSAETA